MGQNIGELVLVLIGAVVILLAVRRLRSLNALLQTGIRTQADIIDLEYQKPVGTEVSGLYYPIIEYPTTTGEKITETYNVGAGKDKYKVGDKLNIVYDYNNSHKFLVDDNSSQNVARAFIGLGIAAVIMGVVLYFVI